MLPRTPYNTTAVLNMEINELANKTVSIRDNGFEGDEYTCSFTLAIDKTDSAATNALVQNTYRDTSVSLATLLGEATPAFYPFGPHIDMSVSDLVFVKSWEDSGQIDPFNQYFLFDVVIVPDFDIVYDNTVVDCGAGGFRFGSLSDFYLPTFSAKIEDKRFLYRNGRRVSQNSNSADSQHDTTKLEFVNIRTEGARNILLEIVRNIRATSTTMNAGTNWYPFGFQGGQGDKTVKLSSKNIKFSNTRANLWTISFEVINAS